MGSGWYGNCLTFCAVRMLALPLDFVHLRSVPSPFEGALHGCLCCRMRLGPDMISAPICAGCLLSSLRSHVRRSVITWSPIETRRLSLELTIRTLLQHNLREEACHESCSPWCGLSNDCCASWCCRLCVLIQLANQVQDIFHSCNHLQESVSHARVQVLGRLQPLSPLLACQDGCRGTRERHNFGA
jgi:hypothetical protein